MYSIVSHKVIKKSQSSNRLPCRFSTYFLPDWLLQFCIYFDFPYCFLFVTYTAKFPVCFFFILLKSFDFVTQSVVFFLKNL